jgi:hypothetical protein
MQWDLVGIEYIANTMSTNGWTTLLGFNEPDRLEQANLTAVEAADAWKKYMEPLHTKGIRLGSPVVSGSPDGTTWLRNFFGNCTGCHYDFMPVHWYGDGSQWMINYVNAMYAEFKKPIWITEVNLDY